MSGHAVEASYPNDVVRVLRERASCRSFREDPIPPDVLRTVLEAGIQAPTGGNLQPYSIIQIENPETKSRMATLCENQQFIAKAPVDLLFCLDLHRLERWTDLEVTPFTARYSFRHFWVSFADTIICAQNVCTAADSLGLGSVYVASVLECFRDLRQLFRLPEGVFPVVLLCLGYPKAKSAPVPSRRLGVETVVHKEFYRELPDDELREVYDSKYARRTMQLTQERLEKLARVCRDTHGEAFATECLQHVKDQGYISEAQRYFAFHYDADTMPMGNEDYLRIMEESGLGCFQPFQPPVRRGV